MLMGLAIVMTTYQLMEPVSDDDLHVVYELHDTTSTEDLVAQGEMQAGTNEDLLASHSILTEEKKRDSFYEGLFKAKTPTFDDTIDLDATTASLRGSTLKIVEDDSNSTKDEDDAEEAAVVIIHDEPKRTDWGPRRQPDKPRNTVGYILPVMTCYCPPDKRLVLNAMNEPNNDKEFRDAALMLEASIYQNSVRNPASNSSYDYEMVALVHRSVETCVGGTNRTKMLQQVGYRVEVVREPIHHTNIKNEFLQHHAPRNMGHRVGMKDLIRLFAYKMEEYPLVVLVDTLTFVLRPPDAIYDLLLNGPQGHTWADQHQDHFVRDTFYPNGTIASSQGLPAQIDIMFTRDYTSLRQNDWTTGMSLAFVPLRPNVQTFHQLINTYQSVPYDKEHGWGHKGYSKYAGAMLTKGLLTYFYSEVYPHRKAELFRCIYNNMADIPFVAGRRGGKDNCRDVKEHRTLPDGSPMPCTDCRLQTWDEIVVANNAMCRAPWRCPYKSDEVAKVPLLGPTLAICRKFHQSWFALRHAVEETFLNPEERTKDTGTFHKEIFQGYCLPGGSKGGSYVPMNSAHFPNGLMAHNASS